MLAFDGSCGACGGIAAVVSEVCGDQLEILPLKHPDVEVWRSKAFVGEVPWAPTLIRVTGDVPRAWTGVRLSAKLAALLGPKRSVRVVRALGELKLQSSEGQVGLSSNTTGAGVSRKRFLKQVGLGAAAVAGILVSGSAPAYADPVQSWKRANASKLPVRYDELASLPIPYRKAAFAEMTPGQKSAAWVAHLDAYDANHDLDGDQRAVLRDARALASDTATFSSPPGNELQSLTDRIEAVFGNEGVQVIATLGPPSTTAVAQPMAVQCVCSSISPYCPQGSYCFDRNCDPVGGCGDFWTYTCDGLCFIP